MSITLTRAKEPINANKATGRYHDGMTIAEHARIQFAAAALQGAMALRSIHPVATNTEKNLAELTFVMVDAMLKAGGYIE